MGQVASEGRQCVNQKYDVIYPYPFCEVLGPSQSQSEGMLGTPSCPYLPRTLLALSGSMFLVSCLVAINFKFWSWILKLLGHEIHIRSVTLLPLTLRNITYNYRSSTLSLNAHIGSLKIAFHFPTPCAPKLVSVSVEDVSYTKADRHAFKSDETFVVVWLLPAFFRRTSSSFVTVKMRGVVIDNVNAEEEAWWAKEIRDNITETVMVGETIRLHDLKTKLWLYEPITPSTWAAKVDVNGETVGEGDNSEHTTEGMEGDEAGEESEDVLDDSAEKARETQEEDEREARARIYASQWMLRNDRNQRVYSFGSLNVELRRPWGTLPYPDRVGVEQKTQLPQGSLVLKATDLTWTKLPRAKVDEAYFKSSAPM